MPNEPEISDLFRIALRGLRLSMRTHTVCTVVSYNPATQKVTVLVDILGVVKNLITPATPINPNPTSKQTPITLKDIPVGWPRTSQGYLTFPLTPGTKGELHVHDRSLDRWLTLGLATDPIAAWTHNLADSVFHPAVFNDADPITPPTSLTHAVIEGPLIALGAGAANPLASPVLVGTEVITAFTTYTSAVATALTAWGLTVPATPISNGVFIGALGAANAALILTIPGWPSAKVFTE
jgi:hypothetical protein